jgi:serine/threonine protein phosphatase PrpC
VSAAPQLRPVELTALSDTGLVRGHNEDRYLAQPPLMVVADGMGGAQAGEVAAGVAVDRLGGLSAPLAVDELQRAIEEANAEIRRLAAEDPDRAGMGTTVTAALLEDGGRLELLHVGDSRAYLFRDGRLRRLTDDHSLVGEMVRRGALAPEEADAHPQRNVITRALGAEPEVEVDRSSEPLAGGDVLLLCTDGLSSAVGEEEIARILAGAATLDDAGRALVDAANGAGGVDNVTVLLARFEPVEATARAPVIPSPPEPSPKPSRPPRVLQRVERRRARRGPIVAAILAVLALGIGAAVYAASRTYFVDGRGETVQVGHGFPFQLGGLRLFTDWQNTGVRSGVVEAADPDALQRTLRGQGEAVERAVRLVWVYGLPPGPNVTAPPARPARPAARAARSSGSG